MTHDHHPGHDRDASDSDNLALFYFLRKHKHHGVTGSGCFGVIVVAIAAGVVLLSC